MIDRFVSRLSGAMVIALLILGLVQAGPADVAGERTVFAMIEEKVGGNTLLTLERAREMRVPPVEAASALAVDRLRKMMELRRWR